MDHAPAVNEPDTDRQGLSYGHDPRANRVVSALLLSGCVAVLVVAALLTPSERGWGTHHQLYFAPCLFHLLTRLPCPFCGMTTAFAYMARGDLSSAFGCHVLGPALYLLTWLLAALGLRGLVYGRWPVPRFVMTLRFQRFVLVVLLMGWLANIVRLVR